MLAHKINNLYCSHLKFWNCVFQTLYFHIMWRKILLHRHFKAFFYFWNCVLKPTNDLRVTQQQFQIESFCFQGVSEIWSHFCMNINSYQAYQTRDSTDIDTLLTSLFFLVHTVRYGFWFPPPIYGPCALCLSHKSMEKNLVHNLQYGPQTWLVRDILVCLQLVFSLRVT